jgi:hypothetical protein
MFPLESAVVLNTVLSAAALARDYVQISEPAILSTVPAVSDNEFQTIVSAARK